MALDYYADAAEIAERPFEAGERQWSERLTDAVTDGVTATEILMALRHHLSALLASGPPLDPPLRYLAESLRADISAAQE